MIRQLLEFVYILLGLSIILSIGFLIIHLPISILRSIYIGLAVFITIILFLSNRFFTLYFLFFLNSFEFVALI
jgi:hypothetical protein